jgi:hypothetical protein
VFIPWPIIVAARWNDAINCAVAISLVSQ